MPINVTIQSARLPPIARPLSIFTQIPQKPCHTHSLTPSPPPSLLHDRCLVSGSNRQVALTCPQVKPSAPFHNRAFAPFLVLTTQTHHRFVASERDASRVRIAPPTALSAKHTLSVSDANTLKNCGIQSYACPKRPERDREQPHPQLPTARKHPNPQLVVSGPQQNDTDADADDFSRCLKISASLTRHPAKHSAHPSRLFNPDRDPIPMRRTAESDAMSDAGASSSYVSRSAPKASPPPRAVPLLSSIIGKMIPFASCFAANQRRHPNLLANTSLLHPPLPTPTPWRPLPSRSPPPQTDRLRLPLSFDRKSNPADNGSTNVFALQLKKLYRAITDLE
ncbi:hypothetical protein R3P38DRAFT_3495537 [Favolaschia claudopus]|uniref:Uncharacterized protein n=1 Tax=Favolaschia claudopus TaxID=2862362 RepID=A0AAV9Z5B0_9AGAR